MSNIIDAERAMYGPFFGSLGITAAMVFTAAGSVFCIKLQPFLYVIGTKISAPQVARDKIRGALDSPKLVYV